MLLNLPFYVFACFGVCSHCELAAPAYMSDTVWLCAFASSDFDCDYILVSLYICNKRKTSKYYFFHR